MHHMFMWKRLPSSVFIPVFCLHFQFSIYLCGTRLWMSSVHIMAHLLHRLFFAFLSLFPFQVRFLLCLLRLSCHSPLLWHLFSAYLFPCLVSFFLVGVQFLAPPARPSVLPVPSSLALRGGTPGLDRPCVTRFCTHPIKTGSRSNGAAFPNPRPSL